MLLLLQLHPREVFYESIFPDIQGIFGPTKESE